MSADRKLNRQEAAVGLCASCKSSRRIESARGSEFWFCQLSVIDARFAKYPRLPVLSCLGYERSREPGSSADTDA